MTFTFDNSYARLPDRFFARLAPTPVARPLLVKFNPALARDLGLDADASQVSAAVFAGNRLPEGAEPLAMAYAGHQFGTFVPQLGDGRAILLGEILTPSGERFDIQLKGSGRTPFSRAGDGRAWLGPVLREYLISEAMHAFGIPTTRALAVVATGEAVYRESALPGAVLTRIASSHVRIGTFEYFLARQDRDGIQRLADYVMARHIPEIRQEERPCQALLQRVVARQAELVARWMGVGFIHGVMNTDNMSIVGETIDYGPCAFMDTYHPGAVFSSIDHAGRYAYGNQPRIAHWNLAQFAQALLPILDEDPDRGLALAQAAIDHFPARFDDAYLAVFRAKLGLAEPHPDDSDLISRLLQLMAEGKADFTNSFRALCTAAAGDDQPWFAEIGHSDAANNWLLRWRQRLAHEPVSGPERAIRMRCANPAVIPRNHRVEAALDAAVGGDLEPFETLLRVIASPWGEDAGTEHFRLPPQPHEVVTQTFCGT